MISILNFVETIKVVTTDFLYKAIINILTTVRLCNVLFIEINMEIEARKPKNLFIIPKTSFSPQIYENSLNKNKNFSIFKSRRQRSFDVNNISM